MSWYIYLSVVPFRYLLATTFLDKFYWYISCRRIKHENIFLQWKNIYKKYIIHAVLYGETYFLFLDGVAPTYNSRRQLGQATSHALNLSAKQLNLLTAPSKVSFTPAVKSFVITRRKIFRQKSNRDATLMCDHSWVKASLIQTGITGENTLRRFNSLAEL